MESESRLQKAEQRHADSEPQTCVQEGEVAGSWLRWFPGCELCEGRDFGLSPPKVAPGAQQSVSVHLF